MKHTTDKWKSKTGWNFDDHASNWDKGAMDQMTATPNGDGTIGYMIEDEPHGREWLAYFRHKGFTSKVKHLKTRIAQRLPYMVPTEWPEQYDRAWRPIKGREIGLPEATEDEKLRVKLKFKRLLVNMGGIDYFQAAVKQLKIGERLTIDSPEYKQFVEDYNKQPTAKPVPTDQDFEDLRNKYLSNPVKLSDAAIKTYAHRLPYKDD